ncbi:MAG TPA: SDR family NAD(P)-dependent oxidoreductase, partial [Acidimicrobiia bacterium]|nr:SDR family NAD(P)-dependent oxidoreductase [Acidimicrobiia bacterium]
MTSQLGGRGVVVTGAGRGVGRGVALACAGAGADVVVAAPGENGEETAATIRERGGSAVWVRCDVTRQDDVNAAVEAAAARCGLHEIVHNATSRRSSEPARLETVDAALWEDHASVS